MEKPALPSVEHGIIPQHANRKFPMNQNATRTLSSLIDDEGLSSFQILIIVLCAMIAMLDGFDTQAIAFVATAITSEWHLPIASFGPIFAIGLVGSLFGAFGFGMMADRLGRKTTLVVSVSVFAVGSLLTGWSSSVFELAALRLLTGLGLGGAMPSIISMTAEYSPRRLRATLVTAGFCGFPLGAVIGAIGSTKLVPMFGWRSIFVVGGCLPIALLPLLIFALPESIRWLAARNRTAEITKVLKRANRSHLWNGSSHIDETAPSQKNNVAALFAAGRGGGTILLWLASFMSLLLTYLLVSWVPTIAQQTGVGPNVGMLAAAVLNVGGILGGLLIARWSDRFGEFRVVSSAYIGGGCLVLIVGLATPLNQTIYWIAGMAGFFCIGAQLCVLAIASGYYPLDLRATGVGSTMGVGRVGAIVGPLVGSLLIQSAGSHSLLFIVVAVTSLIAGGAIFGMGQGRSSRAHP
jgi:MFS transporter, AAHS family, 4-hydroxybenzoate transporter